MKSRLGVAIVIAIAIAGGVWWWSGRSSRDSEGIAPGSGSASRPPTRVTRIDPAQRKQLAERIQRGQAARATAGSGSSTSTRSSSSVPTPPSLPAGSDEHEIPQAELDAMKQPLLEALQDVIPLMKECYTKTMPDQPDIDLRTAMFLTGDPDVGTLVETEEVTEANGKTLPKAFDDCIQDTLLNIELPPLREGDKAKFTTKIQFSKDGPK